MAKITALPLAPAVPAPVVYKQGDIIALYGETFYMVVSSSRASGRVGVSLYDILKLSNGEITLTQDISSNSWTKVTHPIKLEN